MLKSVVKIVAVIFALGFTESAFAEAGWRFMNIPQGARETAMGETGVANVGSGALVWWNPAASAFGTSDIWFQGYSWILDGSGSFGGAKARTNWGGFSAYYVTQGLDGFEVRDRPGEAQGEFTIHQSVFAVGTAVEPIKKLALGVMYKTAFEDIYGDREDVWDVVDLGALYQLPWFNFGASVTNLSLADDNTQTAMRFGLSRLFVLQEFDFTGALESVTYKDDDTELHLGVEAGWQETIYLRAGYIGGNDLRSVSFGLGAKVSAYHVDFALTPFTSDLGTTWKFGIGMNL